jgi:ribosome-associated protein
VLNIDSGEHRTHAINGVAPRARLPTLIQQAATRPRPRRATRPKRAAKEKRLAIKKLRAVVKQGRQRKARDD